ncbi:MAG TPA: hypothetical protein VIL46_16380, partial [Gemmataceae bacterium]
MPSAPSGATPPRTAAPELFGVSALILFLELACIRWLPSHVLFLTFFTNTVLLASFLGMSVGCLIARRPYDHLRLTPYWLALTLGAGLGFEWLNARSVVGVGVGDVRRPEVVFFGTESHGAGAADFFLPI